MSAPLVLKLVRHGESLANVSAFDPQKHGDYRTPLTDRNDFPMPFMIEAADAARRILAGLAGDRFEIAFPGRFALVMKAMRILPYRLFFALTRRMLRR